jgi:hypothetical protein
MVVGGEVQEGSTNLLALTKAGESEESGGENVE